MSLSLNFKNIQTEANFSYWKSTLLHPNKWPMPADTYYIHLSCLLNSQQLNTVKSSVFCVTSALLYSVKSPQLLKRCRVETSGRQQWGATGSQGGAALCIIVQCSNLLQSEVPLCYTVMCCAAVLQSAHPQCTILFYIALHCVVGIWWKGGYCLLASDFLIISPSSIADCRALPLIKPHQHFNRLFYSAVRQGSAAE